MLVVGATLGPYKILAPLGAGGMGEVYRARDLRIGREVAVKILPLEFAADPERLRRFEHEARAAGALSHPNLITLHDVGQEDGRAFLVTELLEGETLREKLASGPLPAKKVIDYAIQIAKGLAAAHDKAIVHRDLKPENLFVTRDGRIKILDFGLVRYIASRSETASAAASLTESGMILGTIGYMAPEQVRGDKVDARADLFAFGCVLYEMLSGKRAFTAGTAVETMSAILNAEPTPLSEIRSGLPPGIERIAVRCLEKDPRQRFQNAHDLAFQLETFTSESSPRIARPTAPQWLPQLVIGTIAVIAVIAMAVWIVGTRRPATPTFERLTFRRGSISTARYSADGRTIVYSAAWDGEPIRIYTTRVDSHESSPLALPEGRFMAVSSAGELAIGIGAGWNPGLGSHTTLARVPLAGGAPRELLDDVRDADWAPDGRELAVARFDAAAGTTRSWLEYPIGQKLYQSGSGLISLRVSPGGDRVALIEQETSSDFSRGFIVVVDRKGHVRRLTPVWEGIGGMAWSPRGDEVWYTAVHRGSAKALHAVSLSGHDRVVLTLPDALTMEDIASDGRMLISRDNMRLSTVAKAPGADRERDLSWQETTGAADLSRDGRTLVFTEWGEAAGAASVIGMRGTDGSPVVKLGDGYAGGLSPDGRFVVGILVTPRPHVIILPTGAGQARSLDPGPIRDLDWSCWAPDGKHVLFLGIEPGHGYRAYVQHVDGGPPRAVTPDGTTGGWQMVSPDGRWLLAAASGRLQLFPIAGGPSQPLTGLGKDEGPIRWTEDGRAILVRGPMNSLPVRIERFDLATGARGQIRTIMPMDPAGVMEVMQILLTPDERAYAYTFTRRLSDLYQVRQLR